MYEDTRVSLFGTDSAASKSKSTKPAAKPAAASGDKKTAKRKARDASDDSDGDDGGGGSDSDAEEAKTSKKHKTTTAAAAAAPAKSKSKSKSKAKPNAKSDSGSDSDSGDSEFQRKLAILAGDTDSGGSADGGEAAANGSDDERERAEGADGAGDTLPERVRGPYPGPNGKLMKMKVPKKGVYHLSIDADALIFEPYALSRNRPFKSYEFEGHTFYVRRWAEDENVALRGDPEIGVYADCCVTFADVPKLVDWFGAFHRNERDRRLAFWGGEKQLLMIVLGYLAYFVACATADGHAGEDSGWSRYDQPFWERKTGAERERNESWGLRALASVPGDDGLDMGDPDGVVSPDRDYIMPRYHDYKRGRSREDVDDDDDDDDD